MREIRRKLTKNVKKISQNSCTSESKMGGEEEEEKMLKRNQENCIFHFHRIVQCIL